jgi:iron complex outermembrane receptor protein
MRVLRLAASVRLALMVVLSGSLVGGLALPVAAQEQPESDEVLGLDVNSQPNVLSNELTAQPNAQRSHLSSVSESSLAVPPEMLQINDLDQAATTVEDWIAQIEASLVQIIGARVEATETGLQLVLETGNGSLEISETRSVGNALIADIPNATIAEEFSQSNPIEGIALVSVSQLPGDRVRVAITGTDALPVAEVTSEAQGLAFAVTLGDADAVAEEEAIQVVVTGEQDEGYNSSNASTATRTDTPLRDTPQSIQVVPQQVLEDRQPTNLVDALRSVPGISQANQSSTSIYEDPRIRGFDAGTDVLRDGTRIPYYTFNSFDSATVERIEVLRGPASVLYGQGSLGGIINIISKQPLSEPYYSVEASAGNFNFYRGAIDFSGPLNDERTLLYRLNLAARTTESFVDFFDRQQFTVAPVVSWQISDRTDLRLSAEYINISGSYGQMGLPAAGTILPNPNGSIPLSRNLSEPSLDRDNVESLRIGYNLEHRFSDNWQLRSIFEAGWVEQDRGIVFPIGLQSNQTLQRRINFNLTRAEVFNVDNYAIGEFATGSVQHQLVLGFNYTREEQEGIEPPGSRLNLPPINIFNPVYNPILGTPFGTPFAGESTANTYGFYIQDLISMTDNLKLLLGGRFDIANQRIVNTFGADGSAQQEVFSPRIGLVYQPIPAISLYANYGRSFRPIYNVYEDGTIPLPERGTLYEVGVKADLNNRISTTLAFYDQTRTNIRTEDPSDPLQTIQVGEQNSRGVEFNISGEILPGWDIIGGYAYTDARVSRDNSFPIGNRINGIPEHSFNLWTTYRVQEGSLQGLGFGLGLFYQGDRQGDLANTLELSSYFRTDAAIFYERDQFRAAVNFRNLFNVDYFESAFNVNRVFPGTPFEVQGTISWRF